MRASFDPEREVATVPRGRGLHRPERLEVTKEAIRFLRDDREVVVFLPQAGDKKVVLVQKRSHHLRDFDQVEEQWLAQLGQSRPRIPMGGFDLRDVQWACEDRGWGYSVVDARDVV